MNRAELISKMAEASGLSKKDTDAALNAFCETVIATVAKGDKVQLVGFGQFEAIERAARNGRDPQTGKPIKIKASKAPKFKSGRVFKDAVNA